MSPELPENVHLLLKLGDVLGVIAQHDALASEFLALAGPIGMVALRLTPGRDAHLTVRALPNDQVAVEEVRRAALRGVECRRLRQVGRGRGVRGRRRDVVGDAPGGVVELTRLLVVVGWGVVTAARASSPAPPAAIPPPPGGRRGRLPFACAVAVRSRPPPALLVLELAPGRALAPLADPRDSPVGVPPLLLLLVGPTVRGGLPGTCRLLLAVVVRGAVGGGVVRALRRAPAPLLRVLVAAQDLHIPAHGYRRHWLLLRVVHTRCHGGGLLLLMSVG